MDEKKWYMSKSIWGSIIGCGALVLGAFGYSLGVEDQATMVNGAVTVAGIGGTIFAIYGRIKASKKIK